MGTSSAMLAAARASLGLRGRPNYITREYASRHGSTFLKASWCDMAVTYWARHSGNTAAVLPGGDRAYTVWHAQDFNKRGHWHAGTRAEVLKAKLGDIVFFDWGNTDRIEAIDHIGVVEKNLGDGRLQTIEGNTSDSCARRVRSYTHIAGYGRPTYTASAPAQEDDVTPKDIDAIAAAVVKKAYNSRGHTVGQALQASKDGVEKLLAAAGQPVDVDEAAIVHGVLTGLSPAALAAAVVEALPPELAEQVLDGLRDRLGT